MKFKSKNPLPFQLHFLNYIMLSFAFIYYFLLYKDSNFNKIQYFFKITDIAIIIFILIQEILRKKFFFSLKNYLIKGIPIYLFVFTFLLINNYFFEFFYNISKDKYFFIILFLVLKHLFLLLLIIIYSFFYGKFYKKIILKTPQVIIIGFISIIIIGSFILYQPFSTTNEISYIDSLFTSTSAVCVTGLIVKDTPNAFTPFGLTILVILIQIGGLGIMALYASIFILLPGKLSLKSYSLTTDALDINKDSISFSKIIKNIFLYTFVIEFIGAIFFFFRFLKIGFDYTESFFLSIFHSISAFCNAGFSLFSNSFESYSSDIYLNIILIFLIILGGIGFTVGYDIIAFIKKKFKYKNPNAKLKPQSKLVLIMYLILTIFGTIVFYYTESNNVLSNMNQGEKILSSIFQSVTTRTAGFNTVSLSNLKSSTFVLMCLLMFIGASSGSTGGGLKVTTFGILIKTFYSYIKESKNIIIANHKIPQDLVKKSLSIFIGFIGFIILWIFLIFQFESFNEIKSVFEVFSAFGTVGLSTGITSDLSSNSKVLIIIAMFIGRVGPLTLVSAMSRSVLQKNIDYPETQVMVG